MVKAFAWAIAKRSGSDGRFNPQLGPRDHWWFLYKNRHPELALRRVDSLQRSRAEALNPHVVIEYFDLLNKTLVNNNLMNCPDKFTTAMRPLCHWILLARKQLLQKEQKVCNVRN